MNAILALLLLLAAVIWLWYEAAGARERARSICRHACRARGVQLLDDTVRLEWMRPARSAAGGITLVRMYGFEFCPDGVSRRLGHVKLRGPSVEWLELEGIEEARRGIRG